MEFSPAAIIYVLKIPKMSVDTNANIWLALSFKYMPEIDDIESQIDDIESETDDLASLISLILDMFQQAL